LALYAKNQDDAGYMSREMWQTKETTADKHLNKSRGAAENGIDAY
jgi:hypothetical protein